MYAVIMAGGSGSGLWPLSRKQYPKQFISLLEDDTMLQKTYRNISRILPPEKILILTGKEYRFIVENQLKEQLVEPERQIILEENSRGTGPAMRIAVEQIAALEGEARIAFIPCDHLQPEDNTLLREVAGCQSGKITLFGIKPIVPLPDLGYIRTGSDGTDNACLPVKELIRSENADYAAKISEEADIYWNLGIFSGPVAAFQEIFTAAAVEAQTGASLSFEDILSDGQLHRCCCKTVNCEWGDLGNWQTIYSKLPRDESNNAVRGDVALLHTANSLALSQKRLLTLYGVENIIAVSTPDAVLVTTRNKAAELPELVRKMKEEERPEVFENVTTHRPWGSYTVLEEGERYKIKRITVNCGAQLSLQRHLHRSEHWVVVSGTAKVEIGGKSSFVHENESVFVPKSVVHRLSNPGRKVVEIIEVQNGEYLGEDDIERLEDSYGRVDS